MKHGADKPGAGASQIPGRWVNDGGTIIELSSHRDGRLSGTIRFGADGSAYKLYQLKGTSIVRPDGTCGIVGTLAGWPNPAVATVWFGELDPGRELLSTKLLSAAESFGGDWDQSNGGTEFRRSPLRRRRSA